MSGCGLSMLRKAGANARGAFGGKIVVDVFQLKKMEKLWGKRRVVFGAKWLGEMFII